MWIGLKSYLILKLVWVIFYSGCDYASAELFLCSLIWIHGASIVFFVHRYPTMLLLSMTKQCVKIDWLSTLKYPASPCPWLHTSKIVEWSYGTMHSPPSSEGRMLLTNLTILRASTELTRLWEEYSFGKIYPSPTRILIICILTWLFTWHVFWLQDI